MPIQVTDSTFNEEVLNSELPVLVDFWANWCEPCKQIMPIINELTEELKDTVKIVKVNIEDAPSTTSFYSIRSIPTLALFKDGVLENVHSGILSKEEIKEFIA